MHVASSKTKSLKQPKTRNQPDANKHLRNSGDVWLKALDKLNLAWNQFILFSSLDEARAILGGVWRRLNGRFQSRPAHHLWIRFEA